MDEIKTSATSIGIDERTEATKGIIDFVATAFASAHNPSIQKLITALIKEHGSGESMIVGYNETLTASDAALVNGYILHYLDYDDVHSDLRGHASSIILPSLLSFCQNKSFQFQHFLDSYIIGIEVAARIGRTIGSNHYESGWHSSSTIGALAATMACAYLLDLDNDTCANALGITITTTSGLRAQFGTDVKPLHIGLAAQKAYNAIMLSQDNTIVGNKDLLPTFYEVYSQHQNVPSALFELNNGQLAIIQPGLWFKLYPCCSANYHAIDATKSLLEKHSITTQNIRKINVIFPPNGDAALTFKHPTNGLEGRFSVEYVIAKLIKNRQLTIHDFSDVPIEQSIATIMLNIERHYDGLITPSENALPTGRFTIVEIILNSQQKYRMRINAPKGSPNAPLNQNELLEKLKQYAPWQARHIEDLKTIKNTEDFKLYIKPGGRK
nr:MmgE/PrpD family protein [Staphylococcus shinii]